MTKDEVFQVLAKHMVEGLMTHSKLADYYGFLGFDGYQKCHEYHHLKEDISYREISNYYLHHYNQIILDSRFEDPNIIPQQWYQHTRADVSNETKKTSIKTGIEAWVNWEKSTKKLYENLYNELTRIEEVASALMLGKIIKDVDYELAEAEKEWIKQNTLNYDLNDIMIDQENIYKKYKKKIKEIKLC